MATIFIYTMQVRCRGSVGGANLGKRGAHGLSILVFFEIYSYYLNLVFFFMFFVFSQKKKTSDQTSLSCFLYSPWFF